MKPREYCCCAIPLLNVGIYATLTEQFVLAFTVGTLSVATPSIVGAATPSFAPWLFAIICYVGAAIQVLGFLAVAREKAILYRRYVTLHIMATVAAFAVAAVWVIMSASRHSTAQSNCESNFFGSPSSGSSTASEAQTLCNIFPWVDVGIMAGLWVFFAICQTYFYVVVSSYGANQRRDHEKYDSLYDPANPLTNDIPMSTRADPWDSRPSTDEEDGVGGYHTRQTSDAAMLGDKSESFSNAGYGGYNPGYPPNRQPSNRTMHTATSVYSQGTGPSQPGHAFTQDPGPTPQFNDSYYSGAGGEIGRPPTSQAHPAEGSFRRKTPRLQKPSTVDFDRSFFTGGLQ